jgi:hypothetical protein
MAKRRFHQQPREAPDRSNINHQQQKGVPMGPNIKIEGVRDGQSMPLPLELDAIAITTQVGTIHIDLAEQVPNMVLMRASVARRGSDVVRLILSPMDSGRLAVGIIRTAS